MTERYLGEVSAGNRALLEAKEAAPFGPAFLAAHGGDLTLPRPLFVDAEPTRALAADLHALYELVFQLPARLFEGDFDAYLKELGLEPAKHAVLRRYRATPLLYGRADVYHDGDSYKALEFNVGSSLGGIDRSAVEAGFMRVPAFRDFAERHGLSYVNAAGRLAEEWRKAAAPITGGADPVVAFLECDGGLEVYLPMVESLREAMAGQGIEMLLGEIGQVTERDGRLRLHGRRIDLVLRYYTENEIVTGEAPMEAVERVERLHEEGRLVLWATLDSALYHSKGCLAMLSDERWRAAFTAEEIALVDRVLPLTRTLSTSHSVIEGERVDLVDYCREHRDELILKPRANFSSTGIVVGWESGERDWHEALDDGRTTGAIVQRRVRPKPFEVMDPETNQVSRWVGVLGPFVMPGGRYSGCYARAMPEGASIVRGLGAGPSTGVFLVEGAAL
ncbi:hypothetical protein AB0K48_54820 [Nonomuraea sp. NPDC055795]